MAKQSIPDRLKRLQEGRCPIHGRLMTQASEWFSDDETGEQYTFVECAQCRAVLAFERSAFGPATLLPEYHHLVAPTA
jgi:hypothetical protein